MVRTEKKPLECDYIIKYPNSINIKSMFEIQIY